MYDMSFAVACYFGYPTFGCIITVLQCTTRVSVNCSYLSLFAKRFIRRVRPITSISSEVTGAISPQELSPIRRKDLEFQIRSTTCISPHDPDGIISACHNVSLDTLRVVVTIVELDDIRIIPSPALISLLTKPQDSNVIRVWGRECVSAILTSKQEGTILRPSVLVGRVSSQCGDVYLVDDIYLLGLCGFEVIRIEGLVG